MTTDKGKSDFLHGFSGEREERQAYREVLDYLVREDRYVDVVDADNDASERVRFCEEMELYARDPILRNASVHQRKIQALVHANQLQEVIAENDGYLPVSDDNDTPDIGEPESSLYTETDEILPVVYPDPDHDPAMDDYHLSSDRGRTVHGRSGHDSATAVPVVEMAKSSKANAFLYLIRDLSAALGTVMILLAVIRFFFDSENLLHITKYSFLLFTVLLLVFIAFLEVSNRLMRRLRYAVGYLFLVATATLSGLLFMQQPWAEDAFYLRGGAVGIIVNFIIHRVIAIGPFWLGVFFAVAALVILIVTWLAGRKINDGLPETK
jgi:hypothetical protein